MGRLSEFLTRMNLACEIARMKKALFNEPVVTAQGAVESGWGQSSLTKEYCNVFGMKSSAEWKGETVVIPTREWSETRGWYWETDPRRCTWRVYPSWNEAIVDYHKFIAYRWWFRNALYYTNDPDRFLEELLPKPPCDEWPNGKPGWATDPGYRELVRAVARTVERLGGPKW